MKQTCSKSFVINDILTAIEREISNGFCSFFYNTVNNLKANLLIERLSGPILKFYQ